MSGRRRSAARVSGSVAPKRRGALAASPRVGRSIAAPTAAGGGSQRAARRARAAPWPAPRVPWRCRASGGLRCGDVSGAVDKWIGRMSNRWTCDILMVPNSIVRDSNSEMDAEQMHIPLEIALYTIANRARPIVCQEFKSSALLSRNHRG
jgi:hypothetical protein